jgi:GT2 family glycosyltransferase
MPRGIREIILTINVPENEELFGPELDIVNRVIRNTSPKGFGANHNTAFEVATGHYFVVVNPDIRLSAIELEDFRTVFKDPEVGACAPVVTTSDGSVEDSFRRFPSIFRLVRRVVLRDRQPDYTLLHGPFEVDWVAAMFVAYTAEAFRAAGGFDERYFMYMEDADICRRLRDLRFKVVVQPSTSVIHDAQRASMRSWKHFGWHLRSTIRFLFSI